MESIVSVFMSWQFLLVGLIVFFIFKIFNEYVGPSLWKVKRIRKILQMVEGSKMIFPPLIGFCLGWVPQMPRPDPLVESNTLTVASLFMVAGLFCQAIVKGVKKALEARGIDVTLDDPPKVQKNKVKQS